MRQVLVYLARARQAAKRGLELEVALSGFADVARPAADLKGRPIELRFFGGLTAEKSAAALSMPVHTVRRELRLALAWLRR
jgi:DNA-directed RNA polymerase specialized sigma24 family protein